MSGNNPNCLAVSAVTGPIHATLTFESITPPTMLIKLVTVEELVNVTISIPSLRAEETRLSDPTGIVVLYAVTRVTSHPSSIRPFLIVSGDFSGEGNKTAQSLIPSVLNPSTRELETALSGTKSGSIPLSFRACLVAGPIEATFTLDK